MNYIKTFILFIIFCSIIYLCGAFIAADIDFTTWDTLGRFCTAMLFIIAIIASFMITNVFKS